MLCLNTKSMKYIITRFILVIAVVCTGLAFIETSVFMQESSHKKFSDADIKVSLIANSDKYELKKDSTISVIVRIDNNSDEKLKLSYKPVFDFVRVGIKEEDKTKLIFGDYYTGRIVSENSSKSKNLFLEKGESLEYVVDITCLELKDVKSSMDTWRNIFQVLKKGSYIVKAETAIEFYNDGKENFRHYSSNAITISYENDVNN